MCLAIPARIKSIDEKSNIGTVDIMGVERDVVLDLVPRAVVEDYILVHAGYGIEVIDEQVANETLDIIRQFPELIDQDHPGMGQGRE